MASISTQVNLIDRMTAPLQGIINAVDAVCSALMSVDAATEQGFDTAQIIRARQEIDYVATEFNQVQAEINQSAAAQEHLNQKIREGSSATDGLSGKIKGLVGAYVGIQGIKMGLNLSDEISQMSSRLNMVNDGTQTQAELQDKVYQMAQRTRGEYLTTAEVFTKLQQRAGATFKSNDETLQFTENLNKAFVVAGASQQEIASASLQLTQALGSGVLRGEELNAVFEAAPNIIQTIADYINVDIGQVRNLAAEGKITADIVKNAMLSATDDISAQFDQMPMTWGQAFTAIKNDILMSLQPVFETIAKGAQWLHDNWSIIEPIFWGIAAAVGAYVIALGAMKVATIVATIATEGFTAALNVNPIVLIISAIVFLIVWIYKWVKAVGGIKIAWLIAVDRILFDWDRIKMGFKIGIEFITMHLERFRVSAATVINNIVFFFWGLKVKGLTILQDFINGAIGLINSFIGLLNKIPGVSIQAVSEVTFAAEEKAKFETAKMFAEKGLEIDKAAVDARFDNFTQFALDEMNGVMQRHNDRQAEIKRLQEENAKPPENPQVPEVPQFEGFEDVEKNTKKTAGNTGAMRDSMEMSQEDLKYLRDIAEKDVINRFTTAKISVNMKNTNNVNSDMDIDGIIDRLASGVQEAMETCAEGVYT